MRKVSEDADLTLIKIESGSVRLVLEGSEAGLERLKTLLRKGQMTEIQGIPVEGIQTKSRNYLSRNLQPVSRILQPIMSQSSKKFNYALWSLIGAVVTAIYAVVASPEVKCLIGLKSELCVGASVVSQQEVELLVQGQNGEVLPGVKVRVFAKGPPETFSTDSNGFATVRIASKGTVRVSLEKEGYPVQDIIINLANEQNTPRTIRLSKSGQPGVKIEPSVPTSTPSPTPTPIPKPTQSPTSTQSTGVLVNVKASLSSQKDQERYEFTLGNPAIVNFYLEDVDNETWIGLYGADDSGSPKNYTIYETTATQSKSGQIRGSLGSGKYFVSVRRKAGDTSFKLLGINYTARDKDLGYLKAGTPINDKFDLNRGNREQFYRFSLGNPGSVNLELKGVQNETWIGLYNDNGERLPQNYTIAENTATSSNPGKIEIKLKTGYYIILVSMQGGDTPYYLSASTTP